MLFCKLLILKYIKTYLRRVKILSNIFYPTNI
nr:MAG TPA: hypothetical protein [Bacteriophage sp.]